MAEVKELPIRDLLLLLGSYLAVAKRRWYLLLAAGLVMAGLLANRAYRQPVRYLASLTFVVNEEQTAGPGVGGLLGQFGLGGGSQRINVDKLFALARSGKIINQLLLDSITVNDLSDRFANHIIRDENLQVDWGLTDPKAINKKSLSEMTLQERALFRRLHSYLLNEDTPVLRFVANKETGILQIAAATRDQNLSLAVTMRVYALLSEFYTQEATGNARASVERLRHKVDSIATALSKSEYRLATQKDTRLGLIQKRDVVQRMQLERQVQILSLSYAEVLRNLETADFALSTKTPFFQIVDEPYTPLRASRANWRSEATKGFVGGTLIAFFLLALFKFYQDVMKGD